MTDAPPSPFDLPSARDVSLTAGSRRRRDRLAELNQEADTAVREERRRAMRALLSRPLLVGSGAERTLVNRHREWLGLWFSHYPGWELHADADAARLVKRPADLDDDTRPCRDPAGNDDALTRRGYVFLCLILSILVRENRQITLKHLAEALAVADRANPVYSENDVALDLEQRAARRDLVQALRVLLDWRVLARVAGHEDGFVAKQETDALYSIDRALLSRLHASRQSPSLVADTDFETRLRRIAHGDAPDLSGERRGEQGNEAGGETRNREIRFRLYRRLLDDPVLYFDELDEDERDYLEKQRVFICREIERATGLISEVRAEGVAMVDVVGDLSDYSLPETGTDGHLTLLLATWLADRLRAGNDDAATMTDIEARVREFAAGNQGWRKDARAAGSEFALARDAVARLRALGLVRTEGSPATAITPLPAIGRFGLREAEEKGGGEDLF